MKNALTLRTGRSLTCCIWLFFACWYSFEWIQAVWTWNVTACKDGHVNQTMPTSENFSFFPNFSFLAALRHRNQTEKQPRMWTCLKQPFLRIHAHGEQLRFFFGAFFFFKCVSWKTCSGQSSSLMQACGWRSTCSQLANVLQHFFFFSTYLHVCFGEQSSRQAWQIDF